MSYFTHAFVGQICHHGVGRSRVLTYKVLFLPSELETALPFETFPRLRVEGEIAEVPVRGAWMPVGDGRRYFIVSPAIKANTGHDVGDIVDMRFRIDDQHHVDVPIALQEALASDDDLASKWAVLTAGKKRMFTFHVASAKTEATELRRVEEALQAIGRGCSIRDLKNAKSTP